MERRFKTVNMNYMEQNLIESVLANLPDKWQDKDTTTKQWKRDLIAYIEKLEIRSVLEIGSARGHTTYALSPFVDRVTCVEISIGRLNEAKTLNKQNSNINYFNDDVYQSDWSKYRHHDLVIIDCIHTTEAVIRDIQNAIVKISPTYLAFDDYGLFPAVKKAVDGFVDTGVLTVVADLGASPGTVFEMTKNPHTVEGRVIECYEGVLCKVN